MSKLILECVPSVNYLWLKLVLKILFDFLIIGIKKFRLHIFILQQTTLFTRGFKEGLMKKYYLAKMDMFK